MLLFQESPDPIFSEIFHEALEYVRDLTLNPFKKRYRPTKAERQDLDETYGELYPELVPYFPRRRLVAVLDALLRASRARSLHRPTDYHWLIIYVCLRTYIDLHNDGALPESEKVGRYEIEAIDFNAIVDQFFFDTDFLMGPILLRAEEANPGHLQPTQQSWRIAAGLKPRPSDLRLVRVKQPRTPTVSNENPWPTSGYVGPYPLRQRDDDEDD